MKVTAARLISHRGIGFAGLLQNPVAIPAPSVIAAARVVGRCAGVAVVYSGGVDSAALIEVITNSPRYFGGHWQTSLMFHAVTQQHETVGINSAVREFQASRLDHTRKERNAGAKQNRIHLQDDLVYFRKKGGGQICATAEPDIFTRLLLQTPDQRKRVSRDEFNILIRALFQGSRKDILLQVRVRVRHADFQSDLVRPASHQNGIKPSVLGTYAEGVAQVSRNGLGKGMDQIR